MAPDTRQIKKEPRKIEVVLPSKPKRRYLYGPPPPQISLVPPRDATAFIVSKLVLPSPDLPGLPAPPIPGGNVTRRRLFYTIGWTDLPSARVCVDAAKILDYVSPRELEDWEYNDFLRREKERAQEQARDKEQALLPVAEKRRPGRPRKGPAQAQRDAAAAAVAMDPAALDSDPEDILAGQRAAGPSLSTPSKRRLEELLRETDAEETGEESESAAIRRQLYSEAEGGDDTSVAAYPEEMDIDSDAVDSVGQGRGLPNVSSQASSPGPSRLPFARTRASPALPGSIIPSSASSSSGAFPSAPPSLPDLKGKGPAVAMNPYTPAAMSEHLKPATIARQPSLPVSVKRTSSAAGVNRPAPAVESRQKTPVTAVKKAGPANPASSSKQTPSVRRESTPRSRGSTRTSTPLVSNYFAPAAQNGAPQLPRRESSGFTPVAITPVPIPARPSSFSSASAATPISTPTTSNNNAPKATSSAAADSQTAGKSDSKRSAKKRKRVKEVVEEEWRVKALLADKYDYDIDNNLVRYFKVLWEGDWPPSQNPSWEPEENISEDLKEEYLKKKEVKMKNGYLIGKSPAKSPGKPPPFLPKKRYSNVAEAFEDGIDELSHDHHPSTGKLVAGDEDEEDEETFVVTDEPRQRSEMRPAPIFSAFDQQLQTYRNVFGR